MISQFGGMFQIKDFSTENTAIRLKRVNLKAGRTGGGYDEKWLQHLVGTHPQALPIAEIEAFLAGAVPVCLELSTIAGPIDLVLVSPRGDIIIVECKLWRNPQARRAVVGQIIDYAKELPRLSYDAFESAIRNAVPAGGAGKADALYVRAGAEADGMDEASFVDAVIRNLRRGRFLLLLVGDGIQEGVESIAEFLQQHAGMHFTLALVEVAIFESPPEGFLVQPRVLMKTQMVPRGVVYIDDDRAAIGPCSMSTLDPSMPLRDAAARPTPSASRTISEARLYEVLDAKVPSGALLLRQLVATIEEEQGAVPRFTATEIILQGTAADRTMSLAKLDVGSGMFYFDIVSNQAASLGRRDAAIHYYVTLAGMVTDDVLRKKKLNAKGITGTASLPAGDLLSKQAEWLVAIRTYLSAISDAVLPEV